MVIVMRKNGQVTIPASIRKQAHLEEGDVLEPLVQDDVIILRPKKLIDASQAWFWTEEWQKGEREADEDIKAGRVKEFDTVEDALAFLHSDEGV
jgi:antitoxin MazE